MHSNLFITLNATSILPDSEYNFSCFNISWHRDEMCNVSISCVYMYQKHLLYTWQNGVHPCALVWNYIYETAAHALWMKGAQQACFLICSFPSEFCEHKVYLQLYLVCCYLREHKRHTSSPQDFICMDTLCNLHKILQRLLVIYFNVASMLNANTLASMLSTASIMYAWCGVTSRFLGNHWDPPGASHMGTLLSEQEHLMV